MKPIHIATSPLTNRIFAGHVLKCGTAWAANKQDVTGAACGAVCEHVIAKGGTVEVTLNGRPKFEITVRDLEVGCAQPAPSVPEDVMRDAERYRYLRARDEGTAGVGCWLEADGRVCDRGWLYGDQLDSAIDTCIEMLAASPEAKP